ncbi:MAG: LysR substrate-binding domain-containing protein [Gammaproteobacteria bacterium]
MDLRHLRYFVAVAEELHFARAAARIGVEQPPLSRAIKELEQDLGVQLLARTTRGTRMTRAGEVFLDDARRILTEVKKARASVRAVASGSTARLRIGVSQSIAQPRLSRLLAQFRFEEPAIELCLVDLSVPQQVRELHAGTLDLGLAPIAIRADGIHSEALWKEPLAAVLPVRHTLAASRRVALSDLLREPNVVFHPELCLACDGLADRRTSTADREAHSESLGNLNMLVELAAAGLGVGLVLAAQVEPNHRLDIAVRPFEGRGLSVTMHALLRAGAQSEHLCRLLSNARTIG